MFTTLQTTTMRITKNTTTQDSLGVPVNLPVVEPGWYDARIVALSSQEKILLGCKTGDCIARIFLDGDVVIRVSDKLVSTTAETWEIKEVRACKDSTSVHHIEVIAKQLTGGTP